ncbi:MAG: hypothetical protein ACRCW0_05450 [Clostridium sp.]
MQGETIERYIIRQIIDIYDIKVRVTDYIAEVHCKAENTGKFPKELINTIQYGEKIEVIAVYLIQYQLIYYREIWN